MSNYPSVSILEYAPPTELVNLLLFRKISWFILITLDVHLPYTNASTRSLLSERRINFLRK